MSSRNLACLTVVVNEECTMIQTVRTSVSLLLLGIALSLSVSAQEKYKDFDDAFSAGARHVRAGRHAEAMEPLEAALKLAKDDEQRLKAYQALVPAYRQLPEIDKMLAAQEFVIRHTERRAGRSLAAGDVASFLFQRGKLDAGI